MSSLSKLQSWYLSQCDDDWEHSYGVTIGTLDNPGWQIEIDLVDTKLENKPFEPVEYGVGDFAETSGNEWLATKIEDNKFKGYCGPEKLEELLDVFSSWAADA